MEKKNRIILFWILTIVGFLTHSLVDALPAFWGDSIAAAEGPAPVGMITFMASLTYLVPVIGILLMVYGGKGTAPLSVHVIPKKDDSNHYNCGL